MRFLRSRFSDTLLLAVVCYLAFFWHLGGIGLIDPDEPFYAQTAREMIQTGDWITPRIFGAPQFEKPILFYWLEAGSLKLLGETEFAARLPAALFATLAVFLTYAFGVRVFGRRAGLFSALILATGVEFCLMSRLVLTDIPLAVFLAASLFSFSLAMEDEKKRSLWMFSHMVFSALAVLTKGPIGSLVPFFAIAAYRWRTGLRFPFRNPGFLCGLLVYLLIAVPWYFVMLAKYGADFAWEFFYRDNLLRFFRAEHPANNHFYYYIGILLLGSIPWMPLTALAAWRGWIDSCRSPHLRLLGCWFATSFLFLTIAASKLPSYAFFLFIPVALVSGFVLDDLCGGFRSKAEHWVAVGIAVLQFAVAAFAPLIKAAKPFATPAIVVAACLGVALAVLIARKVLVWTAVTSAATIALVVLALTLDTDNVEAISSARPIARRMLAMRKGDEPLLGCKFLVRGIGFYTQQPVSVIAGVPQPFWAKHPLPVVVWKSSRLAQFLRDHHTALCALRKSEWQFLQKRPAFAARDDFVEIGDNVIVRAHYIPERINKSRSSARNDWPVSRAPCIPDTNAGDRLITCAPGPVESLEGSQRYASSIPTGQ